METVYRIYGAIRRQPGIRPSSIEADMRLARRVVTKHLMELRELQLVCSHRTMQDGRERRYYPAGACGLDGCHPGPLPVPPSPPNRL